MSDNSVQIPKATSGDADVVAIRARLLSEANSLATDVRRTARARGALLWLAVITTTGLILLVLDAAVRREEMGLRLLALASFAAVAIVAGRYLLLPVWRFRPSRIELAQWIEHQRPDLGTRLSTALQLAESAEDERRFGSRGFRDAALRRWATEADQPVWTDCLDRSQLLRAASALAAAALAATSCGLIWPGESRLALKRLLVPFGDYHWPRRDQLEFQDLPTIVSSGTELQLEVIDRSPPLPDDVEIQFRQRDDEQVNRVPAKLITDVAVGNLPPVNRSVQVRAIGGDDQTMRWHDIEVITPPDLQRYRFDIQPPEYAGRKPRELIGKRIEVLAGSQVRFEGRLSEAVRRVRIDWLDSPLELLESFSRSTAAGQAEEASEAVAEEPETDAAGSDPSPRMTTDRRGLSFSFESLGSAATTPDAESRQTNSSPSSQSRVPEKPLPQPRTLRWRFEIETEDGLIVQSPEIWEIQVIPDRPPQVMLESAGLTQITPAAVVPVRGTITDDLGLTSASVSLYGESSDEPPLIARQVWSGDEPGITEAPIRSDMDLTRVSRASTAFSGDAGNSSTFNNDAESAGDDQTSLIAGETVKVILSATDSLGQVGCSEPRKFTVRTAEEVLYEVQSRQSELLSEVRELVRAQSRNEQSTAQTRQRISSQQDVRQADMDTLAGIAQMQRAITERLNGSERDTLARQTERLLEFLEWNQLLDSLPAKTLQQTQAHIHELSDGVAGEAAKATVAVRESAGAFRQGDASWLRELLQELDEAHELQSTSRTELRRLADRLDRSESLQKARREFADVARQQQALQRETNELKLDSLNANNLGELDRKRAELLSEQRGLADRLQDAVNTALDSTDESSDVPNEAQQQLGDAASLLQAGQATQLMRRAAEEIELDDFSEANRLQQSVADLMDRAMRDLGIHTQQRSSTDDLQRFAEDLRSTSRELSTLSTEQSELADALKEAASDALQSLADRQAELNRRTAEQSRRASRDGDTQTAAAAEAAGENQRQAESAARQARRSEATDAARRAAEQLSEAARQTAQRAQQANREVQQQLLARLTGRLQQLVADQTPIVDDLDSLAEQLNGQLSEQQQDSARRIARDQTAVREVLTEVSQSAQEMPAFAWTLEQASTDMSRAIAAAERYRVDPQATYAASSALTKLELATQALDEEMSSRQAGEEESVDRQRDQPDDGEPPEQGGSGRPLPPAASLRLLRSLQQHINDETINIDADLDQQQRARRLSNLARQQQSLGERVERLIQQINVPEEDRGDQP